MNFKFPDSYKANRPKPFQWLGKILIKLSGWKIKGQISDLYENKKFVAIVAPHTSNWDAVVGLAAIAAVDLKVYFIGKHTVFKGILGKFMKYMGGIPVDRSKPGGLIKDLRIAKELNSGVVLVSLDFLKKELVFGKEFMPTGDDKQDILNIKEYYNAFTPKNPANF